ncbi:hypothetical protein [Bradyrhizobium sp. McL0616]|uniref:hypothetical protein n=1 Tax=Bradyrhizobium sp. McL0616 TaxID=3415674 RepID=UPI003CF12B61
MRTVKPYNSPACEPMLPFIDGHLIGPDAIGDRSNWTYSEELLFAVRPSLGGRLDAVIKEIRSLTYLLHPQDLTD